MALLGGLASSIQPWLAPDVQRRLGPGRGRCDRWRLTSGPPTHHIELRDFFAFVQTEKFMATEQISPRYIDLDSWSAAEMIRAMYEGQLAAAAAVRGALGAIAAAVDEAVPALQRGGRIVYAGAGTSGRIGVQDGTELPPTFDWPSDRLVFAMAGGLDALVRSIEEAEDNEQAGAEAMTKAKHRCRRCRDRHRCERDDPVHDRRLACGRCRGRGNDRGEQQSGCTPLRGGAPPDTGRHRK